MGRILTEARFPGRPQRRTGAGGPKTGPRGRYGLPVAVLLLALVVASVYNPGPARAQPPLEPTVTGITISDIAETTATVTAVLNEVGGSSRVYFRYRAGSGPWSAARTATAAGSAASVGLTGLAKNTGYTVGVSLDQDFSVARTVRFITLANQAPRFPSGSVSRQVENHTPPGGAVGAPVAAADTDPLTYALGGTDDASFTIGAATGQIKVGSGTTLDRTVRESYAVTVTAQDTGGATATAAVAIEVVFPRYVEPAGVEGVGLLERVCASAIPGSPGIPGCPVTLVPLIPLIGVGFLLTLGARNPVVLGGVAVGAAAATSIAISPNPLMISLLVLAAVAVVLAAGWFRKV